MDGEPALYVIELSNLYGPTLLAYAADDPRRPGVVAPSPAVARKFSTLADAEDFWESRRRHYVQYKGAVVAYRPDPAAGGEVSA